MLRIKEKLKNLSEFLLLELIMIIVQVMPKFLIARVFHFLTKKAHKLTIKRMEIVKKNLKIAFPEKTDLEREALVEKIYNHFLSMIIELVKVWKWRKRGSILKKIEIRGQENVDRLIGERIIFFSAHFGNWELIPLVLSDLLKTKVISIARPAKNPLIERKIKKIRFWLGSEIVEKKNAIIKIVNGLQKRRPVFALVDQNAIGKEAVLVKFFQLPSNTNASLARLKLKTFAAKQQEIFLIPVFLYFTSKNKKRFEILPPIDFQQSGKEKDNIGELTQKINEIIESKIREYPEQWFWFHDRWKDTVQEALK